MTKNDGHRKRLRDKFLKNGFNGFLDYEILELLLTLGIPRKDCKDLSKQLLSKYKSLNNVVFSNDDDLLNVSGLGDRSLFGIKLARGIINIFAESKSTLNTIKLSDCEAIYNYLRPKLAYEEKEHFVVMYLNVKNELIFDEISVGILNASLVHPREVFKSAIANNASHIVIAHNHPSGNTLPSKADSDITKRLVDAGKIIGIEIVDHIIIGKNEYRSFRASGLL